MLDLADLRKGHVPAITPAVGGYLAEAGSICLESQGHNPGVGLSVRGESTTTHTLTLTWLPATDQARNAWIDEDNATEYGAIGVAILLAKDQIGYTVIRQSRRGTGFDYWMGDTSDEGFQDKAKLEISGIRQGDDNAIRTRIRRKLRQTDLSKRLSLPAYVIVVEFGRPIAQVTKHELT